jgi:hypothetical protein
MQPHEPIGNVLATIMYKDGCVNIANTSEN